MFKVLQGCCTWVKAIPDTNIDYEKNSLRVAQQRRILGICVDEKQDMNYQCALRAQKTNCIPDCIKRKVASREREVITPSALSLCLISSASSGGLHSGLEAQHKKNAELLEWI